MASSLRCGHWENIIWWRQASVFHTVLQFVRVANNCGASYKWCQIMMFFSADGLKGQVINVVHSMMPSHCCEMSLICTFKKLASAHKIQTLVSRFPPSHTLCEQLSISNDPQSQHNHNMDCRQYAEEEAITGCRRDKAKIFSSVTGRRSSPHHHT